MSKRIPYAMRTLIQQIGAVHEVSVALSDLDGWGVYRTVTFGDADHLSDLFAALDTDPRVDTVDGTAITFTSSIRADLPDRFDIAGAQKVLGEEDADQEAAALQTLLQQESDAAEEYDAEYAVREQELKATPVADLRKNYPDYADLKKNEIVQAVLEAEFA